MKQEDIDFLKELQNEMKTQENDGNASPRFWTIIDYKFVPCNPDYDNYDKTVYYYNDGEYTEFKDRESIIKFMNEYFQEDIMYDDYYENYLVKDEKTTLKNLYDYLRNNYNPSYYFGKVDVKEGSFVVPDTMFVTKKDAQEHLKLNRHHYSSKAHTFCMTAWRSESVERLWDVLENFNWDELENMNKQKE